MTKYDDMQDAGDPSKDERELWLRFKRGPTWPFGPAVKIPIIGAAYSAAQEWKGRWIDMIPIIRAGGTRAASDHSIRPFLSCLPGNEFAMKARDKVV